MTWSGNKRLMLFTVVLHIICPTAHSVCWPAERHCSPCHHVLPGLLWCRQPCLLCDEGSLCSKLQVCGPRAQDESRGIVDAKHNYCCYASSYACSTMREGNAINVYLVTSSCHNFLFPFLGLPSKSMPAIHVSCMAKKTLYSR